MAKKKTVAVKPKPLKHDAWFYGKDGGKLVKAGEPVPHGYVDSPAKVK